MVPQVTVQEEETTNPLRVRLAEAEAKCLAEEEHSRELLLQVGNAEAQLEASKAEQRRLVNSWAMSWPLQGQLARKASSPNFIINSYRCLRLLSACKRRRLDFSQTTTAPTKVERMVVASSPVTILRHQ